ncbi:DsbE family thiol:disulfide interchange protein [Terrarubrum flagellatum]|uniref:DsbE family thiol:disulfide interchange protein n=1 Tax=Terrirubrum flagellatum TaxID=2895980 RepID=UPI003144E807
MSEASQRDAPSAARTRLLVIAPLAIFLALSGLFLFRLFVADPSRLPSAMIGRTAPDFTLPPLEGATRDGAAVPGFDTAALKSGRPIIVNVFASWCVPCHEEHPRLMELAADPSVTIAGIAYKDEPDNSRRFLGAKGNPYSRIGVDRSGRSTIDWGVYGVPETFVVDGSGVILHKHVGPLTPQAVELIRKLVRSSKG